MSREREIALAQVGLRALIDEATGYQEVRARDDLRQYAEELGIDDLAEMISERIKLALASNTDMSHQS